MGRAYSMPHEEMLLRWTSAELGPIGPDQLSASKGVAGCFSIQPSANANAARMIQSQFRFRKFLFLLAVVPDSSSVPIHGRPGAKTG